MKLQNFEFDASDVIPANTENTSPLVSPGFIFLIYIHIYIYIYVCMYVCIYVFIIHDQLTEAYNVTKF